MILHVSRELSVSMTEEHFCTVIFFFVLNAWYIFSFLNYDF
jgi:uncharacterized membrane protein